MHPKGFLLIKMNGKNKNTLIGKSPNSKEFKKYKSALTILNSIQ
jgi:hypothetical protein